MVLEHPAGFGVPLFSVGTLSVWRCSCSVGPPKALPSLLLCLCWSDCSLSGLLWRDWAMGSLDHAGGSDGYMPLRSLAINCRTSLTWIPIPIPPPASCVFLDNPCNLSEPRFRIAITQLTPQVCCDHEVRCIVCRNHWPRAKCKGTLSNSIPPAEIQRQNKSDLCCLELGLKAIYLWNCLSPAPQRPWTGSTDIFGELLEVQKIVVPQIY